MTGLGPGERRAARALVVCVALLGLVGAVLSFAKVKSAVEPSFGELALLVPLGVDVGIAAFTGLDLLMTRLDMRSRWLRLVPWCLVGVTVYLNVADEATTIGQVAHGAMPLLWVVAVESGAHVLRAWAGLHRPAGERMDRIRPSRWLLAPFSTARLWRDMVLWEIRSYPDALQQRQDGLLALGDLQDAHKPFLWRWRAPRRERTLYKLGRLAPAHALPQTPEAPDVAPAANGDLGSAAQAVAVGLKARGERVTRRAMLAGLRERDYKVDTARGGELAKRYK